MAKNPFREGATLYIIDHNSKEYYGKECKFVQVTDDGTIEVDYGNGWCGFWKMSQLKTKYMKEVYDFKSIKVTTSSMYPNQFYGTLSYTHRGHNYETTDVNKDASILFNNLLNHFNKLPKRMKI